MHVMDTGVYTSWNSYLAEWLMVVAQVTRQGGLNVCMCMCVSICLSIYLFVYISVCDCVCMQEIPYILPVWPWQRSYFDADDARQMGCLFLYWHCVWICACACVRVTKECVGKVLSGGKCCLRGDGATVDIGLFRSWVSIWAHVHEKKKKKISLWN